jgi:hypothetical protein
MHDFASDLHLYMCKTMRSKKNVEAHYLEQPLILPQTYQYYIWDTLQHACNLHKKTRVHLHMHVLNHKLNQIFNG